MKKFILIGLFLFFFLFFLNLNKFQEVLIPSFKAEIISSVSSSIPLEEKEILVEEKIKVKFYPSEIVYQGEPLRIEIEGTETPKRIIFNNKEYLVFDYQNKLNALIPISLETPPGEKKLKIGEKDFLIYVFPGSFLKEKVKPPKPLSPKLIALREKERENINKAYETITPKTFFDSPFILPLKEIFITHPFGVQKELITNTQKLESHNGVDLKAPLGTPVFAINDGQVLIAENYLYEGGFILLDHGWGIHSGYLHLSRIDVKTGDKVKKGQLIGLTGNSGLSLGPHLHFMVKLNNIPVDPLRFIEIWQ